MFAGHSQTACLAGASLSGAATANQACAGSSTQSARLLGSQLHVDRDLQSHLEVCDSKQFSKTGKDKDDSGQNAL